MPTFAYSARDQTGALQTGTLNADSMVQATQMIRDEGKYPTAVHATGAAAITARTGGRGIRMSRKDLIHVATQLAIMIDTGVTLSEAMECIGGQAEKPNVKKI